MNIYIDESGSFVSAPQIGAWNAVAALAAPETARRGIDAAIARLRSSSAHARREVKLRDVDEARYFDFLEAMRRLPVALFCVATDAWLNTPEHIVRHQQDQASRIRVHIPRMHYESGKQGLEKLASDIEGLSPQLYVQLVCQVELIHDVLVGAVTYYVQRHPATLREFRWRVDQKNSDKPTFEKTFQRVTPAVLQSKSLTEPFPMVTEFDYSVMAQYEFENGKYPTYLKDEYGIETSGEGWNIGKMLSGNIAFVDSSSCNGVQAVDLLASGIRRCLRRGFADNERAAALLGSIMIQAMKKSPPLRLVTIGDEGYPGEQTAKLVLRMKRHAKPMLLP